MPTRDEILRDLVQRVTALEEAAKADNWGDEYEGVYTPGDHNAKRPSGEGVIDSATGDSVNPDWEASQLPGNTTGTFPVPSEEAKQQWALSARTILENIPTGWPLGLDAAIDSYEKGGPLWLAAFGQAGHDYIMGLPKGIKQQMVREVNLYCPEEGAALARDILRADAQASTEWAMSQAEEAKAAQEAAE